jgi:DNA-binding GntR family transcriptional regulator
VYTQLMVKGPYVPGSCYERIRTDILAGRFDVGVPLLETVLARSYEVSRTPVREALARLEQDGLLRRDIRGYQVRSGTAEDVLEIYEARMALESAAASHAAQRRSDLDLARLSHLHTASADSADPAVIRDLHTQWHLTLWRAAHNTTIESLLTGLTTRLRIYDAITPGPATPETELAASQSEHAQVLAAITARDAPAARDALSTHLARSRDLRLTAFARTHHPHP